MSFKCFLCKNFFSKRVNYFSRLIKNTAYPVCNAMHRLSILNVAYYRWTKIPHWDCHRRQQRMQTQMMFNLLFVQAVA